jgi:hypothetical protein
MTPPPPLHCYGFQHDCWRFKYGLLFSAVRFENSESAFIQISYGYFNSGYGLSARESARGVSSVRAAALSTKIQTRKGSCSPAYSGVALMSRGKPWAMQCIHFSVVDILL